MRIVAIRKAKSRQTNDKYGKHVVNEKNYSNLITPTALEAKKYKINYKNLSKQIVYCLH